MDLGPQLKAVFGALAGTALTGAPLAAGQIELPPDTPWWGHLLYVVVGAAIGWATVYFGPANRPKAP